MPSMTLATPLCATLAASLDDRRAGQRLRYQVFAEELGATLHSRLPLVDDDPLDDFCHHLLVKTADGAVVGYTRLLTADNAVKAGGFYSAQEFDMHQLLAQSAHFVEIGRTCIHRDYRHGTTIATLWSAVAQFANQQAADYLIGCASIPLSAGLGPVHALCAQLTARYLAPPEQQAPPRVPLPPPPSVASEVIPAPVPPLLKAYLRLGAKIGGDPCLDEDFHVADVLIILATAHIDARYARHFFDRLLP